MDLRLGPKIIANERWTGNRTTEGLLLVCSWLLVACCWVVYWPVPLGGRNGRKPKKITSCFDIVHLHLDVHIYGCRDIQPLLCTADYGALIRSEKNNANSQRDTKHLQLLSRNFPNSSFQTLIQEAELLWVLPHEAVMPLRGGKTRAFPPFCDTTLIWYLLSCPYPVLAHRGSKFIYSIIKVCIALTVARK